MLIEEEVTLSAGAVEASAESAAAPESRQQRWAEEAAEFIARQVLEKDAAFRD